MDSNLKFCLTVKEASEYFGIGVKTLSKILDTNTMCAVWVGNKRLVKRTAFEAYLLKESEIRI